MRKIQGMKMKLVMSLLVILATTNMLSAGNCSSKLFSVTIDSKLTIGDVIENLAETCDLTVVISDEAAKQRMNKKLYYVKLKNSTLKGFLNTILTDNDLHYSLIGNKLKISYYLTRTFKIHYISGQRSGKSSAHVTIANSSNSANSIQGTGGQNGGSDSSSANNKTGISIVSNDEFEFWNTVSKEIKRILVSAGDNSVHYTKTGEGWTGPDGQVWEYNPLEPVVNPEAGMITVTGTAKQVNRVAHYIKALSKQIKQQVLIDVRILSVNFDDSTTTGVDWSQLYGLQDFTVNSLISARNNIGSATYELDRGITEFGFSGDDKPSGGQAIIMSGNTKVSDLVKFLGTQGNVKSISSPRVMTLNNQPALISVGKELFYKITSSTTAGGSGGAVAAQGEQIDSVFAGILLDITPEIDASGMITLKVNPSISDTASAVKSDGTARNIPPDLIRRQIASVIKVKDGQHAILGGLISSKKGTKINKVPLLGDLPLLEYAFKSEEKINTIEELVLIITPHIVKNDKSVSLKDLGYQKLNEK
jgi:general secretion pathway protein D